MAQTRFRLWFPICAVGCGAIAFFPLIVSSSDLAVILYAFGAAPIIVFILLLIAYQRRGTERIAALSLFAAFLVFTMSLFLKFSDIRTASRWFIYARAYKREILAQPAPSNGKLRHTEFEGWGFAGADTTVYLVFDPSDALATVSRRHASGKFNGLPCDVFRVRRLETGWYAVQFYTETDWDYCSDMVELAPVRGSFEA